MSPDRQTEAAMNTRIHLEISVVLTLVSASGAVVLSSVLFGLYIVFVAHKELT